MNTLKSLSERLLSSRQGLSDAALARLTGLTRQSIARAMSGEENFNVTTLLAIAEATGQQVLVVPNEVARAISVDGASSGAHIRSVTDALRDL
jgi:transcriptional regulator with XRE-family HTH domain